MNRQPCGGRKNKATVYNNEYLAGVTELYQAEIIGEGLFSTLLATCAPEHAYGMALLLQLEGEAKVRLRPLLWRLGISLVEDQAMRAAGIEEAGKLSQMPWRAAMLELAELAKPYRDRYRALAAAAPESERPHVQFMVDHEVTVIRFAELAAAGDNAAAHAVVVSQLEHPWPAERSPPRTL
jgi:hypothetical protein